RIGECGWCFVSVGVAIPTLSQAVAWKIFRQAGLSQRLNAAATTQENCSLTCKDALTRFDSCPMSKSLIITEKPSVASDIAKALGGFKKGKDYYENERYVISWAVAHLFELAV